jgi:UrcA family protein
MLSALLTPAMALTLSAATAPSDAGEFVQIYVPTNDLNLADPQDRARLERRLNSAKFKVCGRPTTLDTLAHAIQHSKCMATARASYQDQLRMVLNEAGATSLRVSLRPE